MIMRVVTEGQVLGHLPLVHNIVDRIYSSLPQTVDRSDLFQAGVIGLMSALERFDESLGNTFSTYAVIRIRGQIMDELRARDWVPRTARDRADIYRKTTADLTRLLGRKPDDAELAASLSIPVEQIPALEHEATLVAQVSFDGPSTDDRQGGLAALLYCDPEQANPARHLEQADQRDQVARLCATLGEQERQVVRLYYFEGLKMREIAGAMGVTESRICQIHGRIMATLRSRLAASA